MSKVILPVLFFAIVFTACNKSDKESVTTKEAASDKKTTTKAVEENIAIKPESLIGSWVNEESEMGFNIMEGGKVTSINMATLDYNSWQLIENKIILNSTSKGVSNPVTTDEIYIIREVTPLYMIISPSNNPDTKWTYKKK